MVRAFPFNMEELAKALSDEGVPPPTSWPAEENHYLFLYRGAQNRVGLLKISPEVALLLEACDGQQTTSAIIEALVNSAGLATGPLEAAALALFQTGAVTFQRSARIAPPAHLPSV